MDEGGGGWMSGSVAHILIMWNDISSRGERERQRGDQEESINHFAHQHKSHFLQEVPLRVMRWTTLSANLVSALPVLVNWEFGNYKDLISISRLEWWIFKQLRYGFVPQGAITVSHQLNQLSLPNMHSQNNLPSWLKGKRWNFVHLRRTAAFSVVFFGLSQAYCNDPTSRCVLNAKTRN